MRRAARKAVRAESAKTAETCSGEAQGIADQWEALFIRHVSALVAVSAREEKAGPRVKPGVTVEGKENGITVAGVKTIIYMDPISGFSHLSP